MTREEKALIYFKTLRQRKTKDYSSVLKVAPKGSVAYEAVAAEIEVYDTAIKALEQQPCEDAISREAMLKYQEYLHGQMSNEENHKLWEFIKELPPVTPQNTERKTGEIITHYEIYIDREGFERRVKKTTYCSLCKCDLGYDGDILAHYCQNCGVKLEYKGR